MKLQTKRVSRVHKANYSQCEGPNWLLIAAGTLLSTLSIRLGYKLKQGLDSKQKQNATTIQKETRATFEIKCSPDSQMLSESDGALPLVTVPIAGFSKENGVTWASSADRLELPSKPFYHSNCSDSPRVSESGSDIYSKREVITKLRQQLKRRDDMILEMQDQITELQNSLNVQLGLTSHLQLQLDAVNRDLFDSEREIQMLRKAIADHCVGHVSHETRNGHVNGEFNFEPAEKVMDDEDRIEMLRSQVGELKEIIEGKEYFLQSYKEQKAELSMKIREMQQRLDCQLPNIL